MAKFTDEGLHQQAIAAAKSKFKIWPSAYASGWMTRHYRQLYKAKKGRSRGAFKGRSDSLKTWFAEDWKAINSSGKIVGGCGDGETTGKVKCLPESKARSLSKRDRSTLAKRKQKQDPNPNREGAPVMVSSKKREDTMTPEIFAQAILSIEQNYGLRLDARSVWLRMDDWKRLGRDQMGQKCGRGWQGLRGACKRVPKGGDKAAAIKASKVALADKIRKKKGLRDRNAPKAVAKVEKILPELKGSEKQVKWAKDLRSTHLKALTNAIAQSEKHMKNKGLEDGDLELLTQLDGNISLQSALKLGFPGLKPQPKERIATLLPAIKKWLEKKDSASWWIKEGQFTTSHLVTQFAKTNIKAKKED